MIVDTGSMTKAAEILGVSHSGLSKSMSVLQDELGFKVFTPRGRGLDLTPRGKELYEQSQKILQMVGALKHAETVEDNLLRIGLPEVLALAVSGAIAEETDGATLEELDSGEMDARVLDQRVHFAFTFVPFPHADLDHLKLGRVSFCSYALPKVFNSMDAEEIPYVIPSGELQDNPLSIRIRDGWNPALTRRTPFRTNSLALALGMAQTGRCAIYLPEFLVDATNAMTTKDRQLIRLELPSGRRAEEQTRRDVFLVKRRVDEETRPMKAIVKLIRKAISRA